MYPVMRFMGKDNRCTLELPVAGFDRTKVYRGRELVYKTIPDWRIGCNGGLYDKDILNNLSYPEKKVPVWMNSDEVDERLYLVRAKNVAFADTTYYHINHQESITQKLSSKLFHRLKTDRMLHGFIKNEFDMASSEYERMNRQMFYTWRSSICM